MARRSLRQRVLAGETVLGSMMFELYGPGVPQLLVHAGAEYVIYDMEHTGTSLETIKAQIAYCRGLPIAPMARVPRGEYHFLARALDIGCHGVMIPMVESEAQARAIVEATHYPPHGRRGAAFGFAHDDYAAGDPKAKMRTADARTLVIAQIETERGLEQVETIAAVDGIDVLWVGHFDLTNFLGIPGEFDNPTYVKAVERIVAAGRKHKKGLGFMAASAEWARQYRKLGFNMLAAGPDQALLEAGVRGILTSVDTDK
ncbi:MAG TPA: aldolase/citrate lyase family protein [Hyphomicrobiaceae bacterium]|nr:aldolase/citrate lyase family protein [Hyphomicrobiaceae bacterium]